MSLYGDLPQAKVDDVGNKGWVASAKKLQPIWKKPGGILAPPSVARGGAGRSGGRTPNAAGRSAGRGPPPVTTTHKHALSSSGSGHSSDPAPASVHSAFSFFTSITGEPLEDEYDPSKPNDYEEIVKQREKKRREAEEEAERLARMREIEQEIERRKREQAEAAAFVAAAARPPAGAPVVEQQSYIDEQAEAEHTYQGLGGLGSSSSSGGRSAIEDAVAASQAVAATAAAGNTADGMDDYERERQRRLKLSGEEAFAARGRRSGASPAGLPSSAGEFGGSAPGFAGHQNLNQQQQQPGGAKGMGLAQKLLEKMGWREGQGLGRHRQGMATPLVAQKTAAHAGVIVNAELPADKRPKLQGAAFKGTPTRVLLLRNMVGPGEVDEDLEEEVGTELTKYGTVDDVVIFEVTTAGYAPEEAVRIFIKFDRAEAATRALVDLQGRFFGGRQVRVAFFSEDRFDKQQLAPQAGEFGDS